MRKRKDRCIVADTVGDKDAFTAASIKLRCQKDIYEDFCKTAGSYTEYERTSLLGITGSSPLRPERSHGRRINL